MSKPDKFPEWASDSENIEEPSQNKKEEGWAERQPVVSGYFNWFMNKAYEWFQYLDAWTTGHDHKDDGSDGSMPKIHLTDEIDYGDNGYLEVDVDDSGEHRIAHINDGATVTTLQSQRVEARERFMGDTFNSPASPQTVTFNDTVAADKIEPTFEGQPDDHYKFLCDQNNVKAVATIQFVAQSSPQDQSDWDMNWTFNYGFDEAESAIGGTGSFVSLVLEDADSLIGMGPWSGRSMQCSVGTAQVRRYIAQSGRFDKGDPSYERANVHIDRIYDGSTMSFEPAFENPISGEMFHLNVVVWGQLED